MSWWVLLTDTWFNSPGSCSHQCRAEIWLDSQRYRAQCWLVSVTIRRPSTSILCQLHVILSGVDKHSDQTPHNHQAEVGLLWSTSQANLINGGNWDPLSFRALPPRKTSRGLTVGPGLPPNILTWGIKLAFAGAAISWPFLVFQLCLCFWWRSVCASLLYVHQVMMHFGR